jgi:uncharacterized protein (TIGR00369 family)
VSEELRTDHYPFCWGCGLGAGGLEFEWRFDGGLLQAEHVVPDRFQGAPGMVHGGIVAALLDEACGQVARRMVTPAVTSRLEIRYLAPVPIEEPLRISAQVVGHSDRRVETEASILDGTGLVLAHAQADVVQVRPEHFLSTPGGRARGLDWLPG